MPGSTLPYSAIVERYALLVMLGTLRAPITELVLVEYGCGRRVVPFHPDEASLCINPREGSNQGTGIKRSLLNIRCCQTSKDSMACR